MSGSAIEGVEGVAAAVHDGEPDHEASGPGGHRLAHRAVPRERAVVEPFRDS
ncbi:hypothetical protein ACFRMN_02750 [Streptomyces sp. NPDC056835]|uniref:hypothetical protein n=1 Tax=Streptomyces sp. NPDC056835 TaxID=3345956 RepID=UPI0036B2EFC2